MKKDNLKTVAYNTIKQKIITCEFTPGLLLNEEVLTEELKISRTPIRDALGRLEQEGLVKIMPKKGVLVTEMTLKDIHMIYEMRFLYEPYIIEQYHTGISDDDLTRYYKIFQNPKKFEKAVQDNSYFYELDLQLHQLFLDACPNHFIKQSYALIRTQNERFRYISGNHSKQRLADTFREHCNIIHALLQKEIPLAKEYMIKHLEESKKATYKVVFDGMMQI